MKICLEKLYSSTGDYGISLILLSLVVNIILIPVYRLADKWRGAEKDIQARMSKELDSIKKNYSGEKRYFQIKAVYRRYGYNPLYALRVSFGFLIQIPFFFAAYHLLSSYQNLNGVSFFFIKDLGGPDGFLLGLNILPVVMTLINMASVIMYSRDMTNSQKVQLHSLSILFLIVLYNMPSGLVIYWTMNNIISLIKHAATTVKTRKKPIFKERLTIKSIPEFFDSLILSRYTRYFVFSVLFIVLNLVTFYILCAIRYEHYDPLSGMSIRLSIVLLFVAVAVIAPGLVKRYTRNFRSFIVFYVIILLITSIGSISLSMLLKNRGIITENPHFLLFFLLAAVFILLYHFFKLLRHDYGVNIFEPFLSLTTYDKKNFTLALILFNIIAFIWGPTLTVHSGSVDEFNIGFIYILPWQLLLASASFVLLFLFYLSTPQPIKKLLTFALQYLSVTAIIYLVLNKRDVGIMDHFVLIHNDSLYMESHEIFLEVLLLYSVLLCLYLSLRHASGMMNRVMYFLIIIIFSSSVYYAGQIFRNQRSEKEQIVTPDKFELTLSKDKSNVLIFLLDGFSGGAVKHMEDSKPALLESFDGFTWYKNILTTGTGTSAALASLYGGHKYTIENINMNSTHILRNDFFEAFNIYNLNFARHDYKVKYVNTAIIPCNDIDDKIDCYITRAEKFYASADGTAHKKEASVYAIPLLVNAVTIFKEAPHMLQEYIYDSGKWHGIVEAKILSREKVKAAQWDFLFTLKDRVKVADNPTFNFIYLSIPHPAHILDAQCKILEKGVGAYLNDAYCALNSIGQLIPRLKELGVYDNTMIVLVSDHGWWTENKMFNEKIFSKKVPAGYQKRLTPGFVNPLLMVKDINSRGNIRTSGVFLSNADLPSIVCSVIGSCEGIPPDYRKYKGERVLTINLYYPENEIEYLSKKGYGHVASRYEVTDNIFEPSNWKKIF